MCKHTNCQSLSTATARPNCACAESLEILLEAGCMHEFGFLSVPSEHSSDYASDAVVAYANNLVWRRKELKQIARLYIAEARHGDLGLNSRAVLDANVSEVVKTLQEMGICLDPKLYRSTTNRDGESIFHRITTPKVADLFYSLGFRDLSACTEMEVQEIQSENFGEIERFHQIFESLTEELKSVLAGKTEVDFATAKDYFETTWTERMKLETKDGIEDDIEDGIEDLVERTRELGVVWQGPLPSDSAHDDGLYEPTTQHITSLEFWMDEADRIVRGEETLVGV
ncbi:hypothetical protein PG990_013673 [Apiospora arundinis]